MKENLPLISVCGLPFPNQTEESIRQTLEEVLTRHACFCVFTPNPEMLAATQKDDSVAALLRSADLLLPDGVGVLLAARLSGKRLPGTVTGIDTAEWLLQAAERRRLSVFLLGGKPGVAEEAAQAWKVKLPHLTVCGTHHGYFDKEVGSAENQAVCRAIRAAAPDLLFVCLGFPLQERWIAENASSLPSLRLTIGVGGAADVWSGRVRRAPKPIRSLHCEWLWRAVWEPRRVRRLLPLPHMLWLSFLDRFR